MKTARRAGDSKGHTLDLLIERLNDEGFGVARRQGHEIWVQGAFPQERVLTQVERVVGGNTLARLVSVLEQSSDRDKSASACVPDCPGCPLLRLKYDAQLRFKEQRVQRALRQTPNARSLSILPIKPADPALGYRATAKLSVSFSGGKAKVGLFSWGTRSVRATTACPTHHPLINAVAEAVALELERLVAKGAARASAFDWLKHVVVRVSPLFAKAMVTFVVSGPSRALDVISKGVQRRVPEVVSIHVNVKEGFGPQVLGSETRKLWGYPDLLDQVGDRRVLVSPASFFQAHHGQAAWIYDLVRQWANLGAGDTAVDLYCGIGGIAMSLAKDAGHVIGLEVSAAAVADARRNAELNGLRNCRFQVTDVARVGEVLRLREKPMAISLNPPRAGAGARVLEQIAALQPRRMVYVSCDPASLAADLQVLARLGFAGREAQPVDMFPQTPHVETVVRLEALG